ncbi:MAG: FAD-dependent hydroxylase [Geitlerinemataceae cyanobacterium]
MSEFTYDLIIVGGGIPGLTLACGLRESGLRVAVIEAQPEDRVDDRPRAYALSPLSAKVFRSVGVWEQIAPGICHFPQVLLSDADYAHKIAFVPEDIGEPAVYYCAEHNVLQAALRHRASLDAHITCYYGARVQDITYGKFAAEAIVETQRGQLRLSAPLVVAADGARSRIRQQAGIETDGWNYWQSCITAFVSPEASHQNIAHERFWPDGPFAVLPLPDNRCQIVWVAPHEEAKALVALPREEFMAEMQKRYGDGYGSLTLLGEPLVFPASLMHSRKYYQSRLALLADAAHHCHPVGGQGLNLGLRDAAALAKVLSTAAQKQQDLGDVRVLRRYGRRRRLENWVMLMFTDILNRTFSNRWLPMLVARRLVLRVGIAVSPIRRLMLHLMTGFWGTHPYPLERLEPTLAANANEAQRDRPEPGTLVGSSESGRGSR